MHSVLAARTDFSLGESILTTEQIVDIASASGQKAAAITDTMSITGMVDFTNRCKKKGIKPIIGCRLRLVDDPTWRPGPGEKKKHMPQAHFLTIYVMKEAGLHAVYDLLSKANDEDHFYYEAKISYQELYDALDKLQPGDVAINLTDTQGIFMRSDYRQIAAEIRKRVGELCFAAMLPINTPLYDAMNNKAVSLYMDSLAMPFIARPAFYEKDQDQAHEILGAIASNTKITDGRHRSIYSRDLHLMGEAELMRETIQAAKRLSARYAGTPVEKGAGSFVRLAIKIMDDFVDRVSFEWKKQPVSLPVMATNELEALKAECAKGWKKRFSSTVFGHCPSKQELAEVYKPRLLYELSVLEKLNFSGYFLLVQDVVRFAKLNDILVGPGRGSVGGSLVAYLMGITECDPIRFGLLFERFINPERIDLPDADLDFMSARRGEVVDYLVRKYGSARVAGVSNYGRLAAASAIRDVSRVMTLDERDYRCSKLVPKKHGQPVSLGEAADQVAEIKEFSDRYPGPWKIMTRLEGSLRNLSQHAAGIVVAGVDLKERSTVEKRSETAVVCWDKRIVEDQGLVKMDILGLNTLDVIGLTLQYIKERHGHELDLNAVPLDDPTVLDLFARGETTGIFQFESGGMRRLLKDIASTGTITFDEITAATALYRPGPMESGMMDSFHRRKCGSEAIEYDHPLMEEVLRETYGVIVYQEQVMKISQVIAGYTGADADKLRKIMGKKLPEEMKKERGKFVEGCVKTIGCEEQWAGELFDKIEGFAGYGFNKSHSVEYTLISYQAMWLKANYSVEFFAAALSLMDEDKLRGLIKSARMLGIDVSVPDINISTARFEIATDVRLVMPFTALKGLSSKTAEAIVNARKSGDFATKQDFLNRVEKRSCNIKHQTILDKVGAFARIEHGQPRANDPSRIADQIELLPGLIEAYVPINHDLHRDKITREAINDLIAEYCHDHGPVGTNDGMPVKPFFGRGAQFMIIQDCPNHDDDADGIMGDARNVECVIDAMSQHGLEKKQVYWTALVKRPKADKQISPEEIKTYLPYLEREIDIVKPPIIVLLGTGAVRHFLPDLKGKASDNAGQVFYSKDHDCNFVVGFNPGELYFAPEKMDQLVEVFARVVDLLP